MRYEPGGLVAYISPEESADGYLWRGHPGVVEIDLGDGEYAVAFHRSAAEQPIDEQALARLSPEDFAHRVAAIDRGDHPTELGRRLPPAPPNAPRPDL